MGGMHITMTPQSVQRADSTQLPEVMTPTAESGSASQLTSSEGRKVGRSEEVAVGQSSLASRGSGKSWGRRANGPARRQTGSFRELSDSACHL